MKFFFSFVTTQASCTPRHCDPVDNAEKAFSRCKHRKTTWTVRSYKVLADVNQNVGANSYWKLICRKYRKLSVSVM